MSSTICAKIILAGLIPSERRRFLLPSIFGLGLICTWQLLATTGLYRFISSPINVLGSLFSLFTRNDIWGNMYISNIEIFGGVFLSVGLGIVLSSTLQNLTVFREVLFAGLPITFITPLMAFMALPGWVYQWALLPKIVGVMLLSFFPFFCAFWGLRDRALGLRVLLGIDHALPFAFVAMLFLESMASISGLGFSLVKASAIGQDRSEGLAIVCVISALLAAYSWILRRIANYRYSEQILTE
jgi:ABC-type nitrate/sulfonate/bicarbonate transport system permease component